LQTLDDARKAARDKCSSLVSAFVNYGQKMFYNIVPLVNQWSRAPVFPFFRLRTDGCGKVGQKLVELVLLVMEAK